MSVTVRCFAKVNLGLSVLRRRPDGYHDVRTVLQTVDLSDELHLEPADSIGLEVDGPFSVPANESNLVLRAARALGKHRQGRGAHLKLRKAIPPGAGLGGGSSDAACALMALDRLWGMDADPGLLYSLARGLGMDVPFFLFGGACLALGRGDEVLPLPDRPPSGVVVAWPRVGLSTREVYEGLAIPLTRNRIASSMSRFSSPPPGRRLRAEAPVDAPAAGGGAGAYPPDLSNDLEETGFRMVPASRRLKERLLEAGAAVAAMSGSGSAVFGLFPPERGDLDEVAASFAREGAAAFACRTLTRDAYRLNLFRTSPT